MALMCECKKHFLVQADVNSSEAYLHDCYTIPLNEKNLRGCMLVGVYVDEDACKGCMQDLGDGDEGQPCPMKENSCVCKEEVDGRVSGTYLPEPVRPWRRRQQQSWYAAGPLLDRNATVGRG